MHPLIDRSQLLESLSAMGDDPKSSLAMVLDLYLEDAPQLLASIHKAVIAQDFSSLRFAAHSLKSSSATLGAKRLAALCQELEMKDRSEEGRSVAGLNRQLQQVYLQTLAALKDPMLL